MTPTANSVSGNFNNTIIIKENSNILKAISCIPLIGIIPSFLKEISLAKKLTVTTDVPKIIELLNIKNQYKTANVVRNMLSAALIVAGVALGVFGGTFGLVCTGIHIAAAGMIICYINKNNQIINELQTTGFRPGMRFE